MTNRSLPLLFVLGAAIGAVFTFADARALSPRDEASKGLQSLLKERRDTLSKLVRHYKLQYDRGVGTFEAVMLASNRLLDAELELTTTDDERIAIYEKKVANLRAIEKSIEVQLQAGKPTTSEAALFDASAARLEAEIQLLRQKGQKRGGN